MRIRLDGIWQEVFSWEKAIHEDKDTGQRMTVFLCHIGDNRIIRVTQCARIPFDVRDDIS